MRARRGSGGWTCALLALVTAPACGGRLLTLSTPGDDASDVGDGPAQPDDGPGYGGSSGSSGGYGSSSSGAPTGASGGSDASSGSTGGASCSSAGDCPAGLVCCATQSLVATCQAGPCPSSAPLQFCASAVECFVAGDSCGRLATEPEDSYMVCE